MPRYRQIQIKSIPLTKLIEENVDSMASARIQADLLTEFNRLEAREDELKEFIKRWALSSPSPYREAFQHILSEIEEIDKAQDEQIYDIYYKAQHIYEINWLSNKLLKPFDAKGRYIIKQKFIYPLFGLEVIRKWGTGNLTIRQKSSWNT